MTVEAQRVWKLLNGIFCVYKPAGATWKYVLSKVKSNLCKDLNSMETRPVKNYVEVVMSGNEITTNVRPSYADHPLCVGPRYIPGDILISVPITLGPLTSGVLVVGINEGYKICRVLKKLNFTKCYRLQGILGQASANYHIDGKVIARSKYEHIDYERFERTLAFHQSIAQRRVFEEYGFRLTSEEAYDFAVKGLYRPDKSGAPIIYNLKLVELNLPNFTIEVQCIHETELFLMNLIHNVGVNLKSSATCTGLRCIRLGHFKVEHTLLKKYWRADNIIDNIQTCFKILSEDYPAKLDFRQTVSVKKTTNACHS